MALTYLTSEKRKRYMGTNTSADRSKIQLGNFKIYEITIKFQN